MACFHGLQNLGHFSATRLPTPMIDNSAAMKLCRLLTVSETSPTPPPFTISLFFPFPVLRFYFLHHSSYTSPKSFIFLPISFPRSDLHICDSKNEFLFLYGRMTNVQDMIVFLNLMSKI